MCQVAEYIKCCVIPSWGMNDSAEYIKYLQSSISSCVFIYNNTHDYSSVRRVCKHVPVSR